jgi:adhesin/invasin
MIRSSRRFVPLAGVLAVVAGCGHDSSSTTTPGGTPSTGFAIVVDSVSQSQSAVIGSTIVIGFRVMNSTVTAGVPNQTVTFTPATGSGTVASSTGTTDANGHATVSWTFGTTSGTLTLTLSTTGVSVPVNATALAGAATKLAKVSADSQSVVASGSVSLVVRSTDQYGNPVPNVPVTWAATGGVLTPTMTVTGPAGNAAVTFTTAATPATYSITATSPGLTSVTFTLRGS